MTTQAWWKELPSETLTESAWERQMSFSGIEAFEKARYTASGELRAASESTAGQRLMRKLIDRATDSITQMQREVLHKHRTDRNLKGTVIIVPAESSALITLRALIDRTYASPDQNQGYNWQLLANEVARGIELELNFRTWVESSRVAAAEYAKVNGLASVPKSMAEKLIEEEGMTRMALSRWKKTFKELKTYKWSSLEKHYCGEAMIDTVVAALPEAFEKHTFQHPQKKELMVRMTPEFRTKFDDIEMKVAQLQVVKKPMLSRPRPWRKE